MAPKNSNSAEYRKWGIKFLFVFLLFFMPNPIYSKIVVAIKQSDLKNVNVAIYNNLESDAYIDSRIALQSMYLWANATVENITALEIQSGQLSDYDLFVMPGRAASTTYDELEGQGIESLLSYVRNGGAYFAICGGVEFAMRSEVNLYSGALLPVPGELHIAHVVEMRINTLSNSPRLEGLNETFSTLFWGSSYFYPNNPSQVNSIANFLSNGEPGMITYRYGQGCVFLSTLHCEFEENDDRDGTDLQDYHDDPDSEWDLLLQVSEWLVNPSTTQDAIMWLMLFSGGGILGALVILIFKKRKS